VIRSDAPLTLPARPVDVPLGGFPLIASVAPLAAAGVIWLITGSAFVLLFAILGPVIAVASMLDGRRTNKRARRRAVAAHARALATLRSEIAGRHDVLRRTHWRRTPSANAIAAAPEIAPRWTGGGCLVTLGSGSVASGVRLDGAADPEEHRELRDWAATLTEAPVTADPAGGIGIVGPLPLGRALARGLLVQVASALPPGQVELTATPAAGWEWTVDLPHGSHRSAPTHRIVVCESPEQPAVAPGGVRLVIALSDSLADLPWGCATVVRLHGPSRAEVVRSGVHAWGLQFRPELLAAEQAAGVAGRLRERATAAGLDGRHRPLPGIASLGDLAGHRAAAGRRSLGSASSGLRCTVGVGELGEVSLDLVGDGPHAVVGGTTGSGKSELLVTWVAAMAAAGPPAAVTFLLVDFKGGAAFAPLCALPHCVGLITDLDGHRAARALDSLAAELRHREGILRDARARDIVELRERRPDAALPRLVIVVDEFATMISAFPELHALFVDIAARGRSLGVHLILCTQRPIGVLRDALLANCTLRLSLRVNNRADSLAVLGTDAAAALSAAEPGRCLIATATGDPVLCQIATTSEREIRVLAALPGGGPSPRRPWLDPLPGTVTRADLLALAPADGAAGGADDGAGPGCLLGLLDEPERQRYRIARYEPLTDGNLLVLGTARSGKSTALASLAAQYARTGQVESPAADVEAVWDALGEARRCLDAGRGPVGRLLLLDDFDAVQARWDHEYRAAALELLTGLLRDGGEDGLRVVIAVQRLGGALQVLPTLCQSRLLLRLPDLAEHVAAGGIAALFDGALPPGGGSWSGHRIQLLDATPSGPAAVEAAAAAEAEAAAESAAAEPVSARPDQILLVVSGSPARTVAALTAGSGTRVVDLTALTEPGQLRVTGAQAGTVFVGDVDAWQAQWSLLGTLRPRADLVFDGCGLADYRAISRRRDLPPPLAPGRGRVWVLQPDGTVRRGTLRRRL
jgi:S-DNA-T family DNA segregation ATPase FtsK/SpoIIIE